MSSSADLQRRSLLKQLADRNAQQQQQQQQAHHRVLLPPDETPLHSNQLPPTISSLQGVEKDLEYFQNHDIIKGILDHGRHISDFARGIDEELQQTERESVQDYLSESDSMVALHDQIKGCEGILGGMEGLLGTFQSDLGRVGEEIRNLQIQSQLMSIKLVSRRTLEQHLGSFIEHLTVPESMVATILDGQVDEEFYKQLHELDQKLTFVFGDKVARASEATHALQGALEKLRIKALIKVRDFLLHKVLMLRRPKTNIQIIQQTSLLKNKKFLHFLKQHGHDLYKEIRREYAHTLSTIYASHFRTYLNSMEKMQSAAALQGDMLGSTTEHSSTASSMLSLITSGTTGRGATGSRPTTEHVFALGNRVEVLEQLDAPAVVPHMADAQGRRFLYEAIFRNVHKLLIDTATSEFFFCREFFNDDSVYKDLFVPIVQVVEGDLAESLHNIWDMVSLLLMIRINHEHRHNPGRQKVPVLDEYLDRVHLMLWPKLKMLFDHQLASVRSGADRAVFVEDPAPHTIVRRYAVLASSMMLLLSKFETDEQDAFRPQACTDMLERLWAAVFDLLLRTSNMFRDRRMGIIFLIVNHAHIKHVLQQAHQQAVRRAANLSPALQPGIGRMGMEALKECEDQLAHCIHLYVEDQLMAHFPMLLGFVKKAEQQQKRLNVPDGQCIPHLGPQQAVPIVRDFATRWQKAVQIMNQEVTQQFARNGGGRDVLQASMTALLQYYTRMLELLKRQGPQGQAVTRDAVSIPAIMYEIRRLL
mmetsp:Transcript_23537/g.64882  ORF Transcript_23537/g.64882 Transcript_23537/m.64882 type:complete len:760 (+) Transcript_23537:107-2386(+)